RRHASIGFWNCFLAGRLAGRIVLYSMLAAFLQGNTAEDQTYVRRYLWCDSQLGTGFPKGSTSHLLTGGQPQ
ncbi:MAG: hypothetical protein VYE35_08175, partial [Chloroflexota bacterium]|nr:hypothetical protein [Chloroflexota bacterium]